MNQRILLPSVFLVSTAALFARQALTLVISQKTPKEHVIAEAVG